jgi:Na+-transporting NADH:ubiquinone oxidoreductase subunit C
MSDALKSIGFAIILCLTCGLMLTAASSGLKPYQEENIRIDQQKNILKAAGLIDEEKSYSRNQINQLYHENIIRLNADPSGLIVDDADAVSAKGQKILPIYILKDDDSGIKSYILPIETRGLWGKIHGYLAVKNDGETIAGFSIYQHSETPGLGGEIEKKWFQDDFVGKKLVNTHGDFVAVSVFKGKVEDTVPASSRPNYVDGISGATLTGKYLSHGLKEILSAYEPVSIRFRQNNIRCRLQKKVPWCDYEIKQN